MKLAYIQTGGAVKTFLKENCCECVDWSLLSIGELL